MTAFPVRYPVVAFAVSLAALTYLDRVCISVLAPDIMKEVGLSRIQMSYVFSAFTLAYAAFEILEAVKKLKATRIFRAKAQGTQRKQRSFSWRAWRLGERLAFFHSFLRSRLGAHLVRSRISGRTRCSWGCQFGR